MEIRGLLCFNCNSLLRPRWNAATLRAAADYLESPPLRDVDKERATLSDGPSPPLATKSSRKETK
jgi:hypothetical protein